MGASDIGAKLLWSVLSLIDTLFVVEMGSQTSGTDDQSRGHQSVIGLNLAMGTAIYCTSDIPALEQQLTTICEFNMRIQFPAKFSVAPQINRQSARMFRCGCDTKPWLGWRTPDTTMEKNHI